MSGRQPLHVLVGLIRDPRGRWLVSQRRPGTELAGFWEFPGGKRQPGEAPFAALRRELEEELGIDVLTAEPWLALEHDYPDKTVLLDVWRVLDYRGEVGAREGQALDWVAAGRLAKCPLLPADLPIVAALQREDESGEHTSVGEESGVGEDAAVCGDAGLSKSRAGSGRLG